MAAARASLSEVLTPEAYEHLDALNERLLRGCQEVIERYGLPGYPIGVGAKGCVTFSPERDRRLRVVQGEPGRASWPTSRGSTT